MWQCPCSGGCRWRSVARPPTIRSRAADIATTRSASAIGGSPWVQRSLSPRSATARLRTTIEPITAAHRTGIASDRSDGPTVSPIDANDQRRRSPGRMRPPASSIDPTDVSTRPAAADAEQPRRRPLERCDTEQQAQRQPDDQDETTHAFEAHQRQRPIGDRDVGRERRSPRAAHRRAEIRFGGDPEQVGDRRRVPVGVVAVTAAAATSRDPGCQEHVVRSRCGDGDAVGGRSRRRQRRR